MFSRVCNLSELVAATKDLVNFPFTRSPAKPNKSIDEKLGIADKIISSVDLSIDQKIRQILNKEFGDGISEKIGDLSEGLLEILEPIDFQESYDGELEWLQTQADPHEQLEFWRSGGASKDELSWLRTKVPIRDQCENWKLAKDWISQEEYHKRWEKMCSTHPGDLVKATVLKDHYEKQPAIPSMYLVPKSKQLDNDSWHWVSMVLMVHNDGTYTMDNV